MAVEVKHNAVVSQEGATVGDENMPAARKIEPEVVQNEQPAQVSPPRQAESDTVNATEVHVAMDEVILDPSSPLAVQVPDAGRGSLDLPAHRLSAPTVEDVFAEEAAQAEDNSEKDES